MRGALDPTVSAGALDAAARFAHGPHRVVEVPGVGPVQDEDIVAFTAGGRATWFNGTAHGLTSANLDIDAFSLPNGATP